MIDVGDSDTGCVGRGAMTQKADGDSDSGDRDGESGGDSGGDGASGVIKGDDIKKVRDR